MRPRDNTVDGRSAAAPLTVEELRELVRPVVALWARSRVKVVRADAKLLLALNMQRIDDAAEYRRRLLGFATDWLLAEDSARRANAQVLQRIAQTTMLAPGARRGPWEAHPVTLSDLSGMVRHVGIGWTKGGGRESVADAAEALSCGTRPATLESFRQHLGVLAREWARSPSLARRERGTMLEVLLATHTIRRRRCDAA